MDNPTTLPTNKLNTTPTAGPTNSLTTSPTTGRLAFHSATLSGINKEEYVAAIVKGPVDRKKIDTLEYILPPNKTTRRNTNAPL